MYFEINYRLFSSYFLREILFRARVFGESRDSLRQKGCIEKECRRTIDRGRSRKNAFQRGEKKRRFSSPNNKLQTRCLEKRSNGSRFVRVYRSISRIRPIIVRPLLYIPRAYKIGEEGAHCAFTGICVEYDYEMQNIICGCSSRVTFHDVA